MALSFDFITDEDFRSGLERDYREMTVCSENGAWKAVHVLAGSIIEAVLVDYLVGMGMTKPDPLGLTLGQLIDECEKAGVLSDKAAQLSSALKSYRNLIHPGRALRLNDVADAEGAVVAHSLVSIIVREVAAIQQKQYGLTAEQIVRKFESDASALGISELQGGKVITKPIPREYVAILRAARAVNRQYDADSYVIPMVRKQKRVGDRDDRIIYRTVKRLGARAEIEVHPHSLRAAFAVEFLETHPGELEALRRLLGHSKPETTQIYLRRFDRERSMESVQDLSWGAPFAAFAAEAPSGFEPL